MATQDANVATDPLESLHLGSSSPSQSVPASQGSTIRACRFYGSSGGCRAGAKCRFLHASSQVPASDIGNKEGGAGQTYSRSRETIDPLTTARVVSRPTPQAQREDPRAFQVGQMERRFKPVLTEHGGHTALTFGLKPSDPDFPYEIEQLQCVLNIPASYPQSGKPTLRITNSDIPRGFQINIERGFDSIVSNAPTATLLGLMNRLDKQLEIILSGKQAETFKMIIHPAPASKVPSSIPDSSETPSQLPKSTENNEVLFNDQQLSEGRGKRDAHVRQLEARFGKEPSFERSGNNYSIPITAARNLVWPQSLQNIRRLQLKVPNRYPLEPCSVKVESDSVEAKALEASFMRQSQSHPERTLTQHINYLLQHLPAMSSLSEAYEAPTATVQDQQPRVGVKPSQAATTDAVASANDRPHLKIIPRPPEWDPQFAKSDEDDDGDDDDDETDDSNDDKAEHASDWEPDDSGQSTAQSATPSERGVLLSFPHIELHGIELLEVTSLSLTVKCDRCKDLLDTAKLRPYDGDTAKMRHETCKKCAIIFSLGFRADMIHVNAARAGYLDLEGCSVVDMLPSEFTPTCAECSSRHAQPVVAVRGDAGMAVCRQCHRKMTFKIAETKFLNISPGHASKVTVASGPRRVKENLGISVGHELPRRGRCSHYGKSYRWFRFSCCSKVFPCDRCHDEQSEHHNEHANRMICGFCSREQNFRPSDCATCHAVLVGQRGSGFWEGGKGTRDRARMSKKDPRKYKRTSGSKVGS